MEQMNNYLEYVIILLGLIFCTFLGVRYFYYWKKVKEGFLKSGTKWPLSSQAEISETVPTDPVRGHKMMWAEMGQAAKIVFTLKTDDPAISKPLRGMRRILLSFFLIPSLLIILTVTVFAFLAV